MNANEFADELEKAPTLWFKDDVAGKWIIEKLRQQQAEIEVLKKFKAEIDAENAKLFEVVQKANAMWDRATGKAQEK
jgi:ABC-type sugar transport system substrate-binding protein